MTSKIIFHPHLQLSYYFVVFYEILMTGFTCRDASNIAGSGTETVRPPINTKTPIKDNCKL